MDALPTGTVTFLFTDIEGSTQLWERDPDAMNAAVARHDDMLASIIQDHGGYVFKRVGDAFCAAFERAPDALEAAIASQRAIQAEPWPSDCVIRVRMALHTGAAEERNGDYFGPEVNRIARLLAAGYGGQMLLSLATQRLVQSRLPASVRLREVGEYCLKDLIHPERIFQAVTPDLPADFPTLKTLDMSRNNLPLQSTPFVGRVQQLEEVCGLVRREDVRLLTLTGPGGIGKTRLALQVAAELLDEFADGVYLVSLELLADSTLVLPAIARTLHVQAVPGRPLLEIVEEHIQNKRMLLVLDNFEHVLPAGSELANLLASVQGLKVLATSRQPLGLSGEHNYRLEPLVIPDPARVTNVEALYQYEATALFLQRAKAALASFALDSRDAPAVAEICRRLDGLPLALELAAARIRHMTPRILLARLNQRLKLLVGGAQDRPARHQTLRAAIDWSFTLLPESEQRLFAHLAVFAGGWTLDAAESICGPTTDIELDTLEGVTSLVDVSLVRHEETNGELRFTVLETIREYAQERLLASGDAERVTRGHASYYLALAEQADLLGPAKEMWLKRLEAEQGNLRTALECFIEHDDKEAALRLVGALLEFWHTHGHLNEGGRLIERALRLEGTAPVSVQAQALAGAGMLACDRGDYEQGEKFFTQSLSLFRELDSTRGIAAMLANLGTVALRRGDYERAARYYDEGLALSRTLGNKVFISTYLSNLGNLALSRGDRGRATSLYEESLLLRRELGDDDGIALTVRRLATVALEEGNDERAKQLYNESLALLLRLGNKVGIAACLEGLARVAGREGQPERAAHLWSVADSARSDTGAPLSPLKRRLYEPELASLRGTLGESAFAKAWRDGRAMPLEQAAEYALGRRLQV